MQLKHTLLFTLLTSIFAMGNNQELKAQNQYGWTYRSECLTLTASANILKPDSCLDYWWQIDGKWVTGSTLSYKFTKPGTYQVCLKVKNICKSVDSFYCKSIKVDTCPPNACLNFKPDFTWKADCRNVRFLATSGLVNNSGVSYSWTWGDGSTSTGTDPSKTFVKDGIYKVCLKATWKVPGTTTICVKEICKEVKISCSNPCNIKGELKVYYGTGGQVKFEAFSSTGYYYTWKFGDGSTGTGKSISKWYKKPGTYEVCVRICDKTQKCCTTICKKIVIEEPCRLQGGFLFKSGSSGTVNFVGYSTDKNATYTWNFGDGTSATGKDPQKTYKTSGTYNVCVTIVSSDKRCKITICKKVVINLPVKRCTWGQAGFSIVSTNTCAVVKLEAWNLADSCISYNWTVNGVYADSIGGRLKTITLPKNGSYTICLKLYNSCTKCDTVICKTVNVSCYTESCNWAKRGAGFSYTMKCPNLILEGNNLNDSCIGYSFTVSNANNVPLATFNGRTQSIGFSSNGWYWICMKLTNSCKKCDTTICKKIYVDCSTPCNWKKAGAGYTYRVDCKKVTLTANNLNNGCVKYTWYSAGAIIGTGQTATVNYTKNGTYSVCLKLNDTCKKCDTSICQNININCNPCSATAKFRVDSISKSGIVYVTNLSSGGYSYSWDWGDSTYSKLQSPGYHAYKFGGSRKICLTVWDSLGKCSTTFCLTVQIVKTRASQQPEFLKTGMQIYPNPADQTSTVSWAGTYNKITVYSASGKMVYQSQVSAGQTVLNTASLPPGIYTIQLNGDAGLQTGRFVVERQP